MEVVGSLVVLFSALYAVIARDYVTGGLVGLAVSYALQVSVGQTTILPYYSDSLGVFSVIYRKMQIGFLKSGLCNLICTTDTIPPDIL